MATGNLPLLTFPNISALESWLAAQPEDSPGAWLRFAKQSAPGPIIASTITKTDAIDCALAHGWIDGQLGRVDERCFKVRFTPRKPDSAWSQVNRERAERLMRAGRMTRRGQMQVDQAKADGRWAAAYASQGKAILDADLQAALNAEPAARDVFDALDAANRFSVLYRVRQAKTPEKRAAKIAALAAMLARGETFHPRRARRDRGAG